VHFISKKFAKGKNNSPENKKSFIWINIKMMLFLHLIKNWKK